jgi:hypothetical protein
MAKYVDGSENGSGLYTTRVPEYTDAADIQEALKLYHYGSDVVPTVDTLGVLNGINTQSIAGHLKKLANDIDLLPTLSEVTDLIDGVTEEYSELAGDGIVWDSVDGEFDISPRLTLISPKELATISATAATGAIDIDVMTSSVNIRTSNSTGNYTLNVRGDSSNTLNSLMSIGESITVTFESPNGSTAYYATGYTIDGNSVTPKWLGGAAPSVGNTSSTDLYMLQIRKTANATFTCLASLSKFA